MSLCILIAPEIVVGAVIVTGVVVVAVAIKEELDVYRRASRESAKPETQTRPSNEQERLAHRKPNPEGLGRDLFRVPSAGVRERPWRPPVPSSAHLSGPGETRWRDEL